MVWNNHRIWQIRETIPAIKKVKVRKNVDFYKKKLMHRSQKSNLLKGRKNIHG